MKISQRLRSIGPGAMVAAAFIGPGTVTTASVTGAEFGYALVWTIVFSILATIVLQEMSARLGIVSREGLGEALREQFDSPLLSGLSIALVVSAIGIGTAAYETGNILGGAAGLAGITGISAHVWGPTMGLFAAALLWTGRYKLIEKALVALVAIMAISFVIDAIVIGPDLGALALGFVPSVPAGSTFLITGLIGTTVVGYNLFLHAGSVQERWSGPGELPESRADTVLSILIGGLITIAILVTAAAAFPVGTKISNVSKMADQIRTARRPLRDGAVQHRSVRGRVHERDHGTARRSVRDGGSVRLGHGPQIPEVPRGLGNHPAHRRGVLRARLRTGAGHRLRAGDERNPATYRRAVPHLHHERQGHPRGLRQRHDTERPRHRRHARRGLARGPRALHRRQGLGVF